MNNIITFQEALALSSNPDKRYLLLGNGFSTSLFPNIFSYRSLSDEADFSNKAELKSLFDAFGSSDFEKVIRAVEHSCIVLEKYSGPSELILRLSQEAEDLKQVLIKTIADRHPAKTSDISDTQKNSCLDFLDQFKIIYTLNYDVLLYWCLLHGKESRSKDIDDGFRLPDDEFGVEYRIFDSPQSPTFYFMHGGLHIYDAGSETRKYVWADARKPIIRQVQDAITNNLYPLFVAEGTSNQKLTRINHSAYLSKALRSFESVAKMKDADIFIIGHSLNDTDDHIFSKIRKGNCRRLFISIYKGNAPSYDQQFIVKAKSIASSRPANKPLEVVLFDAESANIWSKTP